MNLLEGKPLAQKIQEEIKEKIEGIKNYNKMVPCIAGIQTSEDPSAKWYMNAQKKLAEKLGIDYRWILPDSVKDEFELRTKVAALSEDFGVHGIFISMPLPENYDSDKVLMDLDFHKDVEGIHPTNLGLMVLRKSNLIPPTAYAAYEILRSADSFLRGKKAVVIGQSAIVGRPLQLLLGQDRVTTIVCNTGTSEKDLANYLGEADIVIACAGRPKMIRGDWIKEDAIVIDVGTTEVDGKLCGDVDFESASEKASYITPVPGGVGPLTTTMLMQNLMKAYSSQLAKEVI